MLPCWCLFVYVYIFKSIIVIGYLNNRGHSAKIDLAMSAVDAGKSDCLRHSFFVSEVDEMAERDDKMAYRKMFAGLADQSSTIEI